MRRDGAARCPLRRFPSHNGKRVKGRIGSNSMHKSALQGLIHFDSLPYSARASLPVVCGLFSISPATAWRRVKAGLLPTPIKEGGSTRWIVGELRAVLKK